MALLKKKIQETQENKSEFVGGIWVKESANGVQYLSISINGVNYVAFENKNRTSDKSPDYSVKKPTPYNKEKNNSVSSSNEYTPKNTNEQNTQTPQNYDMTDDMDYFDL
ncbi:hypothetical protein [Fusobacterium polymorphum]|uniref:Uncharacterized protein n=1 Tax=Fusobacterium nucleatum subsp. polymorphum TaxID=76857 RepID=A0A2C6BJG8_FUSNP|nr:hypothetical protein [Fusobacterium polymorphum]PHI06656.1 hypothetical protein CBG54_06210 [Fusobacterium polymorphum]